MKPAWQAWIARWLGVDATFLAAAAAHLLLSWLLPVVMMAPWPTEPPLTEDIWMLSTGWLAGGAGLLGFWTACGPGRLAVRSLWAVALSLASWSVLARLLADTELLGPITAAVGMFTGVMTLVAGLIAKLAFRTAATRTVASGLAPAERWQFRLADLLLLMLVAAIVTAARAWLVDFGPLFYEFGSDMGGQILYVIRCGGAMCAAIVLAGTFSLLRDKPKVLLTLLAGGIALVAAVLLTWLPLEEPSFGSVAANFRMLGEAAAGSLLATIGTLLPLRAWGWRMQRQQPAAGLPWRVSRTARD
jgi:hypothetical protein